MVFLAKYQYCIHLLNIYFGPACQWPDVYLTKNKCLLNIINTDMENVASCCFLLLFLHEQS